MIKTFRGNLLDGEQERIRLSTKKGKIGYKILKFELSSSAPGVGSPEHICKLFKVLQATVDGLIDFSDGNLLASAVYMENSGAWYGRTHTIFEQEIFNQDIYITHQDSGAGTLAVNYYIELETMSLTDNAATVSTLRDIRLNPQVGA